MSETVLRALEVGEHVSRRDAALLTELSLGEYEKVIRRIKASGLPFLEDDLQQDLHKHMPAFGIRDPAEYVQEARQVVRTSNRILAHVRDGQIQFQFFGTRGFAVVDRPGFIRGYYAHPAPGAVEKAFDNLRRIKLWLRTEAN